MNKLLASTLVSIGISALAASPLMAQTPATPGAHMHHDAAHQHEQRAFTKPSERIEARLAYVRTALKITDAQQPQWNAFADTLRRQAAAMDKRIQEHRASMAQHTERRQINAVDRLERQQQFFAAAAERLSERLAVQKPLYAVLTSEQKQVADQVLAMRGGPGGNRMRGPHRMG